MVQRFYPSFFIIIERSKLTQSHYDLWVIDHCSMIINVLVCCEESQTVCKAFLARGFNAFSCDIQQCSGKRKDRHFQRDCFEILEVPGTFIAEDGTKHYIEKWHLVIAHPPCTYLSKAGALLLFDAEHNIKDFERYQKGLEAKAFFLRFFDLPGVDFIAVENPVPMKIWELPHCTTSIQPYEYGHPYSKLTLFWLFNLPPLLPTDIVMNHVSFVKKRKTKKARSKTFKGVADAMADQWGDWIIKKYNCMECEDFI